MRIVKEMSLREFKPWAGAVECFSRLYDHEITLLEDYFEELSWDFGLIEETTINDMFWFDDETIITDILNEDYDDFYARKPLR